jgi:DNA-binding PadR family transcriptional regulator
VLRVEQGSLYPALHRMAEEGGWLKARWVVIEYNRRAQMYELTAHGRRQLNATADARNPDPRRPISAVQLFSGRRLPDLSAVRRRSLTMHAE